MFLLYANALQVNVDSIVSFEIRTTTTNDTHQQRQIDNFD